MNSLSLLKCLIVDLGSAYYIYANFVYTSIYVIKIYLTCLAFAYIYKCLVYNGHHARRWEDKNVKTINKGKFKFNNIEKLQFSVS